MHACTCAAVENLGLRDDNIVEDDSCNSYRFHQPIVSIILCQLRVLTKPNELKKEDHRAEDGGAGGGDLRQTNQPAAQRTANRKKESKKRGTKRALFQISE